MNKNIQIIKVQIRKEPDMKTVQQLKSDIYHEVDNSGFLKNVQAQVKAHVLDIIDKETKGNKQKLGFQYQHPVLKKLRNYPLTSLCMDLIQEFLESFKFKHTLNVFKKEINRDLTINRQSLNKQFSLDLSGKDQSVLLSIVGQVFNGDVKLIDKARQDTAPPPKKNNFMSDDSYNNNHSQTNKNTGPQQKKKNDPFAQDYGGRQAINKPPQKDIKPTHNKKYEIPQPTKPKADDKLKQQQRKEEEEKKRLQEERQKQLERQKELERQKQIERQKQLQKEQQEKEKDKKGGKGKKNKKEEQKPPEGATDLLADVVGKFKLQKDSKKSEEEEFRARKAFSQDKQPKKVVPEESGTNKIRGLSMGKIANSSAGMAGISSFMKFSSFNNQQTKNESIDEQLDELQQSKDSTRRNPLYSSSESGFDKSNGYDQSVDSMAIEDYEYFEKAKKFSKKN